MTNYLLKRLACAATLLLFVSACTATTEVAESAPIPTQEPITEVEPTAVVVEPTSTPRATLPPGTAVAEVEPTPAPAPTATPVPTVEPTVEPTPLPTPTRVAIAAEDHSGLAGSRGLTLQWISWEPEDWGTIEFVPLVDGSYAVDGTQIGPDGDLVSVTGTLVRVSDRELRFTGDVVVQVSYTNEGQPCVRSGEITFLATGDRRFWRMQDLLNCDGVVTDYVDIYFG